MVTESVAGQFSSVGKTSTLPVTGNVNSQPSTAQLPADTNSDATPVNKDFETQSLSKTDTTPINKNGAVANRPSSGGPVNTATVVGQISTGTNKDVVAVSTDTQKTSYSQNEVAANTTATTQLVRRARIRPKVGLVSTKTPVAKSSTRTQVKKTTTPDQTNVLPASVAISSKNAGAGQTSIDTAKETQNSNVSSVKITNNQPLAGSITKTSTKNATGLLETSKEPNTLKRTTLTRRSRITPNVGEKTSKAAVQRTVPVSQSTSCAEVQSDIILPDRENGSKTSNENVDQSNSSCEKEPNSEIGKPLTRTITGSENADGAERSSTLVDQPLSSTIKESENVNIASSEKTSNIERTPITSEKDSSNIDHSSSSTSTASQNLHGSGSEHTKSTTTPRLTRRNRFKSRGGIVGGSSVPTNRTQEKPSAVVNKPASSRSVNVNNAASGQGLTVVQEKSVSGGTKSAPQSTVSLNERSENRTITEPGDGNAIDNVVPTNENAKPAGHELPRKETRISNSIISHHIQVQLNQASDPSVADHSTLFTSEGLSDKRQQAVATENSNAEQTCSENNLSFGGRSLQDSSQDVVILPQDNDRASRNIESSSASCLPVMMEDSSILPQGNMTCDSLPSRGVVPDTPEVSTQTTAEVNTDHDFSHLYHLENADDLLRILLSAEIPGFDSGTQEKSGISVDTSRMLVDMGSVSMDTSTPNVHADPNKSIFTPSPSTRLENESRIVSQNNQSETRQFESRDLPQNNQSRTISNKGQVPTTSNVSANFNNRPVATSRLVVKRQRSRPKNKQRPQPIETPVLDISTIPIASNIEIEPEISTCDDIDHPVLELPDDLIREDLTQSSPKANTSSGGLKRRFQQRRSGAVKLVLSRKRSESSAVDKEERSSTSGDKSSTSGNRSSTSGDRNSNALGSTSSTAGDTCSTPMDTSARDSPARNRTSKVGTENSREIARRARPVSNIQIRRKTSKKKSRTERRISDGSSSVVDNAHTTLPGSTTVPVPEKGNLLQKQTSITSQQELPDDSQSVSVNVSESPSSVEVCSNTATENTAVISASGTNAGIETESSVVESCVHEMPNDFQSEIELTTDSVEILDSVQNNASSTVKGKGINSGSGNDDESQSCVANTSVHDLSKDDEIEIVLEVIGTAQGYTDVVCGSANAVSSSGARYANIKQTTMTDASLSNDNETNVENGSEKINATSSLQQSNDAVHGQKSITDVNLSNNCGDNVICVESAGGGQDEFVQSSIEVVGTNNDGKCTDDGQTKGIPNSGNGGSVTVNSGSESLRSSLPVSTIEESLCNNGPSKRLTRSTNRVSTANSGRKGITPDPRSSTPLHNVSYDASLASDVELNSDSRSTTDNILSGGKSRDDINLTSLNKIPDISLREADSVFGTSISNELNRDSQCTADDILVNESGDGINPIPSPRIQDISLNIPESVIEAAIRNTSEPLPDIVECPECPEFMLCLTTVDETSINRQAHNLSQTQPGTLEDNVARATRRASGEFDAQELLGIGIEETQTPQQEGSFSERRIGISEDNGDSGGASFVNREQTPTSSDKDAVSATNTATNGKNSEIQPSKKGAKASKSKQKGKASVQATANENGTNDETVSNEKESDKQLSGKKAEKGRSRQKPKPNIQRKRKARGKIVDDDEPESTTGGNSGSAMQEDDGNKRTSENGDDHLGVEEGSLGDISVQDDSLGSSYVQEDGLIGDTCVQDGSLGDTTIQPDTTTEGSGGLEASLEVSTPEVPSDPIQDASSKKSGSRKRQGKAVKPKIPAKRTRKKPDVIQESENVDGGDESEQRTTETPDETTASTPTVQETEDGTTTQKRKRGRRSKKTTNIEEASEQTENAPVEKPASKRRKSQRGGAEQGAEVNIASMKICDMISYNPMTNPMTSENQNETQSSVLSGISSQSGQAETVLPATEEQPEQNAGGGAAVCAPRVTIDADGNIVLDEESLVIDSTPVPDNLDREVVFENANQQYTAAHKKKNIDRWGKQETLYFYEVLSQTGTDFSLMAKLFPKRNRTELKRKFKREEKVNRDLIDKALSQRIPLAASLFADCLEETEEEMERSFVVPTAETAAQA
ncbi:---NA--- [Paramuricea clavata]|uniref:---NA n=1 Tax=Paramuricea clavata TaxID=317549 RepID=A0A6S7G153_PARCT|nr:---NA--- [Paramuricea clavata]